ncbi:hypothetical protein SAMD00019534_084030 [Acytostelium subglobosum LB1]|nr:hypothetical protein SAMD00019534_084030 [Acytostelium subglobosum LB1]GAM25228.1 hypothetical protein SAMD00019534_084030 [Acytostelium subglobosum LB1]|eukprot:XP_012751748.1 hypothetical protein SAMD00019534_084030 [Acytostelium subglobosum LB1]
MQRYQVNSPTTTNVSSGKHKFHGIKFEVGIRLDGYIVWVGPPQPGSKHDLTIFDDGELANELLPGEKILADSAYVSKNHPFVTPIKKQRNTRTVTKFLTVEQRIYNFQISRLRIKIEHCFPKVKALTMFGSTLWITAPPPRSILPRSMCPH